MLNISSLGLSVFQFIIDSGQVCCLANVKLYQLLLRDSSRANVPRRRRPSRVVPLIGLTFGVEQIDPGRSPRLGSAHVPKLSATNMQLSLAIANEHGNRQDGGV